MNIDNMSKNIKKKNTSPNNITSTPNSVTTYRTKINNTSISTNPKIVKDNTITFFKNINPMFL